MQTTFTKDEQRILDTFYDTLKDSFGITAQWPTLVLRSKHGDITLQLQDVSSRRRQPVCAWCEEGTHGLEPATIRVTHSDGYFNENEVMTCYDCRCPK